MSTLQAEKIMLFLLQITNRLHCPLFRLFVLQEKLLYLMSQMPHDQPKDTHKKSNYYYYSDYGQIQLGDINMILTRYAEA